MMTLPKITRSLVLLLMAHISIAQPKVTICDEQNIKRKSLALINNLADKYNLFLESDSYDRTNLLESMTLSAQFGLSIFENDQVIIEDDFITKNISGKDNLDKKVDIYFNDLGIYYGLKGNGEYPNEGKSISFSNITTSKIMYSETGRHLYLQVFFEVIYDGIDSRSNLPFKMPCNRVAEIKIQKIKDVWQVVIQSIRNFDGKNNASYVPNYVLIEPCKEEQNIENLQKTEEKVSQKKIVYRNPIIQAYRIGEKWGLKNVDSDSDILPPTFYEIEDFVDLEDGAALALVNQDGLWGFINPEGNLVIKCIFDYAESFSKEKRYKAKVQKGMKIYFIDKNGN